MAVPAVLLQRKRHSAKDGGSNVECVLIALSFERYADFSGRAKRSEFWWFYLGYTIALIALSLLGEVHLVFGIAYGEWRYCYSCLGWRYQSVVFMIQARVAGGFLYF